MKNLSTILIALIVLSGLGLGVTFFVLKSKKEETPSPSVPKDTSTAPTEHKPPTNTTGLPLEMQTDISVPYVDTLNRKFEYSMSYLGIQHKGEFVENGNNVPFVRKSVGTFVIRQRAPVMKTVKVPDDKNRTGAASGGQKDRGGVTSSSTQLIEVQIPQPSDFVDLEIRTKENYLLQSLTVNLATGAMVGGKQADPNSWDGN